MGVTKSFSRSDSPYNYPIPDAYGKITGFDFDAETGVYLVRMHWWLDEACRHLQPHKPMDTPDFKIPAPDGPFEPLPYFYDSIKANLDPSVKDAIQPSSGVKAIIEEKRRKG